MQFNYENISTLENKPAIYVFTNLVNGKRYCGETMTAKKRLGEHLRGKDQLIHKALKKYGRENFDVTVTYYPFANKKFLVNLEKFIIQAHNSLVTGGWGYNVVEMGVNHTGMKRSEETRKKQSEAQKGISKSPEHRSNLRKPKSLEGRANMRKTPEQKAKIAKVHSKPIHQLDLRGNSIATFPSSMEAGRQTGINQGSISKVANGKKKHAGSFKWAYIVGAN